MIFYAQVRGVFGALAGVHDTFISWSLLTAVPPLSCSRLNCCLVAFVTAHLFGLHFLFILLLPPTFFTRLGRLTCILKLSLHFRISIAASNALAATTDCATAYQLRDANKEARPTPTLSLYCTLQTNPHFF